jgi:hypothetical protein
VFTQTCCCDKICGINFKVSLIMAESPRKKSPRAPSIALDEALDRALKAYDKERLHPAPTQVVAQNIGYKSANNGAALSTLAALRYYGLLDRPKEGLLAVAKEVESFRFAPNEELRSSLLVKFLRQPSLFSDLLEKYESGLPSDANLKYELIQRGFAPAAAESVLAAFKRSVEFASFYERKSDSPALAEAAAEAEADPALEEQKESDPQILGYSNHSQPLVNELQPARAAQPGLAGDDVDQDRIPVRLPGGRRAWLLIPSPFYSSDKARLKAQIDLLLTEDEEAAL